MHRVLTQRFPLLFSPPAHVAQRGIHHAELPRSVIRIKPSALYVIPQFFHLMPEASWWAPKRGLFKLRVKGLGDVAEIIV